MEVIKIMALVITGIFMAGMESFAVYLMFSSMRSLIKK